METKDMIPVSQAGFRRRSTTDIFILTHLMQRERNQEKRRRKIYMMFANLKAAFNKKLTLRDS